MSWSAGVANWDCSVERVTETDASTLTAARFQKNSVDCCTPLLIRGATQHWAACNRWCDNEYLQDRLGGNEFTVHHQPVMEMRWRRKLWPDRFAERFEQQPSVNMPFEELRERAKSAETVFSYAVGLDRTTSLSGIADDIGEFEFVRKRRKPNYYKPVRAFIHGVSYTDWHYHPDDETLMCQFGRRKVVHILPPSQKTWDVFFEIAREERWIGSADVDRYPRLRTLVPVAVIVEPGDALYIPPNWWHAVECSGPEEHLGITLAWCWASPFHVRLDPRFPFRRFMLRHGRLLRRFQMVIAAGAWAGLRTVGWQTLRKLPTSAGINGAAE